VDASPGQTPMTRSSGRPQQRSLVRSAVTLLVQRPNLATAIEPPWTFAELRQPGIPLLIELIALCRERPEITTGALLEHFAEREEAKSLQKLAVMDFPGGEDESREEFLGAIRQLDRQTESQRRSDLQLRLKELEAKGATTGLTEDERNELRQLLIVKETRLH